MQRISYVILALLVALAAGCSGNGNGNGEPDANGGGCCPDRPEEEIHVFVEATATDLVTGEGIKATVAAVSPMDALGSSNPPRIVELLTNDDGTFKTDCFDVTRVELGLVMLCDDEANDGADGTYYPVGTGIISWLLAEEKVCVEDSIVYGVPNTLIDALNLLDDIETEVDGVAMGLVLDASGNPIEGAVVIKEDGTDLDQVYYPSADYSVMDAGPSTSASGFYAIPPASFGGYGRVKKISAREGSRTFSVNKTATVPGFGYFVEVVEQP